MISLSVFVVLFNNFSVMERNTAEFILQSQSEKDWLAIRLYAAAERVCLVLLNRGLMFSGAGACPDFFHWGGPA